jgi:hypothetical protein
MKNIAKCNNCKDVIESKFTHDFVTCSCFRSTEDHGIFVDGGQSNYRRCGWKNENDFIDLCKEYEEH